MDIKKMLADLSAERDRIDRAIEALQDLGRAGSADSASPRSAPAKSPAKSTGGRRQMSAAARKRISDMMKQRWAERKRRQRTR